MGVPGAASSGRAWAVGSLMQLETNVRCRDLADIEGLRMNVRFSDIGGMGARLKGCSFTVKNSLTQ
jgi:hypothetical protein